MSVFGVICAGGIGSRMNGDLPKQFLDLAGKPVIIYSTEKFISSNSCDEILVLVPQEWIEYTEKIIKKYINKKVNNKNTRNIGNSDNLKMNDFKKNDINDGRRISVFAGGADRNETILKAIQHLESKGKLEKESIFVTHDAARPLVNETMIEESISKLDEFDAATVAVPATDTILFSEDGMVADEVPDRTKLYQIQTPQSFRALEWKEKYDRLTDDEKKTLTDATKLYTWNGCKVGIVRGTDSNIKITYPKDIAVAEGILKQ